MRLLTGFVLAGSVALGGAVSSSAGGGASASGLVAFAAMRGKHRHVFLIRADGTGRRQLTRGNGDEACPSWSPDGRKIALVTTVGLRVMTASGRTLWERAFANGCPVWSPDGTRIAFLRYPSSSIGVDLDVVGSDARGPRKLASLYTPVLGSGPVWSPDGQEIAFIPKANGRFPALAVVRLDGSPPRVLRLKPDVGSCQSSCWVIGPLAWAPGKQIAFMMIGGDAGPGRLYSVAPDGSHQMLLSGRLDHDSWPAWSPDGKRIAFTSENDVDHQIRIGTPTVSEPVKLTQIRSGDPKSAPTGVSGPAWSPDGQQIACRGEGGQIFVVSVDHQQAHVLVRQIGPEIEFRQALFGGASLSWQPGH